MSLAFLVPLFLAGLAALAVPVLVHLRHRERKEPVRFPSLMFLRRIPFREVRRQQIHHWPLFLLRALAVALLALAFARPFLRRGGEPAAFGQQRGREVVVLLDRSASMGYGSRWARARDSVRAVFAGLGSGDRATLVPFTATAAAVVGPTADRTLLDAALDAAVPGTGQTRFSPALRAGRDLLLGSELPERELVLVSDFQRTGWRGEAVEPLPEGTVVRTVDLSRGDPVNVAIVGVDLRTAGGQAGTVTVAARVAVTAGAVDRVSVRLELDGRQFGEREADLRNGPTLARFGAAPIGEAPVRGVVQIQTPDSLRVDDEFRFLVTRERPLRVLLASSPGSGPFLDRALAIINDPATAVTRRTGSPRSADLARAEVAVLDDSPISAGDAGAGLLEFVRLGGGLVVALGGSTVPGRSLPPLVIGGVVDRTVREGTIGSVHREHPLFEPFRAPRSGDFAAVRVFRYRALGGDSLEVLARYDDGAPALVERRWGAGRILVLTSALDNLWSDLPVQPVFLPLVRQMVTYAARRVERPAFHTVGQVASIGSDQLGHPDAVVVVTPSGERTRRTIGEEPLTVALEEAGFHEVREARPGGRVLATLAVNPDPDESNLAAFDPVDLALAAGATGLSPQEQERAGPAGPGPTAEERERAQGLWWYALAAVLALLATETLYANRLSGFVRVSSMSPAEGA